MFRIHAKPQHEAYHKARKILAADPEILIALEKYCSETINDLLIRHVDEISRDYDEASYLYPFWKNYPPDERGRAPRGDQYPWIEVGEHAIGVKIARYIASYFESVRDTGLPTGPDQRFVVSGPEIEKITKGLTSSVWLMIDIKSVGPRDDFSHTVLSHNQVSGDGTWPAPEDGIKNRVLRAIGLRRSHDFHPTLPPLFVLSDGTIAPTILLAIKPIYKMLALDGNGEIGQPLLKMELVTIPNGLLLLENPNYLAQYPSLLYPGKDDKGKNPLKVRARLSFTLLSKIADWRVKIVNLK